MKPAQLQQSQPDATRKLPPIFPIVLPAEYRNHATRHSQLDLLLESDVTPFEAMAEEMVLEPGSAAPGIFYGLRAALLLNTAVGLAGLLAYEVWAMVKP